MMNLQYTRRYLFLLVLMLLNNSYSKDSLALNYFPLQYGNQWNFQTIPVDTNLAISWSITDTIRVEGKKYFVFEGMPIRQDSAGAIFKYVNNKDVLWFDFSSEGDSVYNYYENDFIFTVDIKKDITANTPIGEYENCVHFHFYVANIIDRGSFYTFAPDVGFVEYANSMNSYQVYQATINDQTFTNVHAQNQQPADFELHQNYPNPFNSFSKIQFSLQSDCHATLQIYSITGQKIETLLDNYMDRGQHVLTWDASAYATGLYVIYLKTEQQTRFIKSMVIK